MFGVNIEAMALAEGKKEFKEHPEVKAALDKIKAGDAALASLISSLTPADIQSALTAFNAVIGNKISAADLAKIAVDVAEAGPALTSFAALIAKVEAELAS